MIFVKKGQRYYTLRGPHAGSIVEVVEATKRKVAFRHITRRNIGGKTRDGLHRQSLKRFLAHQRLTT